MSYRVFIKPSARKELEALPDPLLQRIDRVITALGAEPRPRGCVRLRGMNLYRIRVGDYRVLYSVDDRSRLVEVTAVGHRRDVYR
ncbi:MAG: type II toxin-antitoxin system RelE/ParE family toxin [Deltaproteobacteria bacterium]|nr:type II toxin-antitoxin system RelE/ParE family toxin [Deltaproteobacteria bacterium]MBI3076472.1 type II toxin-antitoxin system RelE/ParE family toxin [Deltaproteobacteria bacterium]